MLGEGSGQVKAFLECRYYDEGLKCRSFQQETARPDWAPPADWIGFQNEFPLCPSDAAVEFARFKTRAGSVTWLALYHHAADLEYGDRQNYAGIGVWFANAIIHSPAPLIDTLDGFRELVANGKIEELRPLISEFLQSGFLAKISDKADVLPAPLSGFSAAASPEFNSEIKEINSAKSNFTALVTDAILMAQFVPSETGASRLLLKLNGGSAGRSNLEQITATSFSRAIAKSIPSSFLEMSREVESTANALREEQTKAQQQSADIQRLSAELEDARAENLAVLDKVAALERALNESGEHQRHVQLIDTLSEMRAKIESGNRENMRSLSTLQSKLANDLSKLPSLEQAILRIERAKSKPSAVDDYHSTPVRRTKQTNWLSPIWMVIIGGGLLVFLAIAAWLLSPGEDESTDLDLPPITEMDSAVSVIPSGERFDCTPHLVWDGDGPIWCEEGPRVRLNGINAREIDETCDDDAPCPNFGGVEARDALAVILGEITGRTGDGHVVVEGPTLSCLSTGGALGERTGAWCEHPDVGDLACLLIEEGIASQWDRYWRDHEC